MRVASSRCSVLDGTVALRSDAPPLWWSATGDLTASRPHVLAHMGHGLRPLLLARVAKNRRCLPPAHRAPAAKTTTSKALLWPVALSDHCSVILFNYSCLELKFWLLLWICYDHYNLSSIILCICFETWHTQPQIPGSATDFKGDGPANQGFWWSVRATPQVDKMKGGFFVDVNVRSLELWS